MRIEMLSRLDKAASIVVTYNGEELLTLACARRTKPKFEIRTPKESGVARAVLVKDGKRTHIGEARYYFDDFKGACMLLEDGAGLYFEAQNWAARPKILAAISLLEKLAPDSEEMMQAYRNLAFTYFRARTRKHNVEKSLREGLQWFEKAIAVCRRLADPEKLSANLLMISTYYTRVGDHFTAMMRARDGLEIQRANPQIRGLSAWTQTARCFLALGQPHRAQTVISEGVALFAQDPYVGYLWILQGRLYDLKASACRSLAQAVLPADYDRNI